MSTFECVFFGNQLPHDDLSQVFRKLHLHSKDAGHSMLARFLSESTQSVRNEIALFSSEIQALVPSFNTLLDWGQSEDLRQGPLCGAIEGVLLVLAHVGAYIGYIEDSPERLHGLATASHITGLGVGILAGTVPALSLFPSDLPLVGADVVRIAFRMGVYVYHVSEIIEARDPLSSLPPDTWAYVVQNMNAETAQTELDQLCTRDDASETAKIFISAVSPTSVTLSGPPTRLASIFHKSPLFRDAKSFPLPVFGGICHAPHIYGEADVNNILADMPLHAVKAQLKPVASLLSTSTGEAYPDGKAIDLFSSVLAELMTKSIHWQRVVDRLVQTCGQSSRAILHCFGNSLSLNDLTKGLKANAPGIEVTINNLCKWYERTPLHSSPPGPKQDKLAIVGMSCRLPGGATSLDKFWDVLQQGLDVSRQIPADRFDVATHYDPTGTEMNKSQTQYGCFIDEPGLFDAPFFNMSPREAQVTDPQMRLALVTAYEALEQAGFLANRTPSTRLERIGTYYGQAADDYREVNQGQEVSTYYIPGGCRAFGPGRINYFFKFAGPSYSIDTACSSGLAAVEVACQALWNGDVDTAVAGGVNVLTNPDGFSGLCNGHFLTKGHNACKTWDATADGYCRADGVGTVVIKRLKDAEADNDNILGVVLGAGTNHSATAVSITHPHAGHQAFLSRQVLTQAGVDPLEVSYVELHGTGTQAGDSHEMKGILDTYAPLKQGRSKKQPLHIGASKANVGHSESAAGTTALIKTLLMLQKNAIPPHVGIKTAPNPALNMHEFGDRNVHIPFAPTEWPQVLGKKRIAAVNNFGAAGGNTTLLLEEAPSRQREEYDPRPTHVISISAKTKASLTGNVQRMIEYLHSRGGQELSLADLSYTTTARRYQHNHRIVMTASNVADLEKQLAAKLATCDSVKPVSRSLPSIAFAFTGQGAAYKSSDLELYRDSPTFRQHIDQLDSLAQRQGFPSFKPVLDGSFRKDYPDHSPVVTQLSQVCCQIALVKYWATLGVKPDVVMGHSLGEYAAMFTAGAISASDAIFMVGRRAKLLEERCTPGSHMMVAVRASLEQIEASCDGKPFTVACVNSPVDTVLSGDKTQMDDITAVLQAAGFRCFTLDVAFAFHSEQTDPILDDLEAIIKSGVVFHEPQLPIISPLLGKVVFDSKTLNANYIRRATRETVDFLAGLVSAEEIGSIDNDTLWVEIGPHPVCTGFVKATLPDVGAKVVPSMKRGEDNWKTIAESMAILHRTGVEPNWNEFHRPFEANLRVVPDLPSYAFNEKNHWLQYNGDWCLTKGNTYYGAQLTQPGPVLAMATVHEITTSTVQQVVQESFEGESGSITIESDLMQPDFLAATNGHRMNGCGVVTSSIHGDIAYTLGTYLERKLTSKSKKLGMDIANLVVTKGLVANSSRSEGPQKIRVSADTTGIRGTTGTVDLRWRNVDAQGMASEETFATAELRYGDAEAWLSAWSSLSHLVHGRVDDLERLANEGKANRFSRSMAYKLFGANLVDYADKYRGMQSVVHRDLEAYADVQLPGKESVTGHWTVPPFFIDSVAHLAGWIMNCSDSIDTDANFCVTPGWASMRFAKPLTPGAHYRSYVKMIPTKEDPSVYLGDVYIMQGGDYAIVGVVEGIRFCRYPRILLDRFFSPPDKHSAKPQKAALPATSSTVAQPRAPAPRAPEAARAVLEEAMPMNKPGATPGPVKQKAPPTTPDDTDGSTIATTTTATPAPSEHSGGHSTSAKALLLIANEAALDVGDLTDEVSFTDLGVDSLMSLVIAEKLQANLGVKVGGTLFLDYPTIGDMRSWLDDSYA